MRISLGSLATVSLLLATGLVPLSAPAARAAEPRSVCELAPLPGSAALSTLRARIASAQTGPVRLWALGSSTTYGMDLTSLSQRWPDRLMGDLAADGVAAATTSLGPFDPAALLPGGGARMIDAAVPGEIAVDQPVLTLPGLLAARLSGNAPSIVLNMIGANDYWLGESPDVFGAALRASALELDTQLVRPIQVLIASYADPATTSPAYPWSDYRARMRAFAAEDPAHRIFIDLTPWFDVADVPGADPEGLLDAGGVHPSAAGQATIAALVLRALGYGC